MTTTSALPKPAGWLRLAWIALAANSLLAFGLTLLQTWQFTRNLPERLSVGLAALGLTPDFYFWFHVPILTILFLTHFVVAALIFLRRPDDRMAVFVAVFLMTFGTAVAYPSSPEYLQVQATVFQMIPILIENLLSWPLLVAFFALFPDGRFVPGWMRYVAVYGFFFALGWGFFPATFAQPKGWLAIFLIASVILVFGASLYAQVYRYRRHASPLQRQQIKWLVYGLSIVVVLTNLQQIFITLILPAQASTSTDSIWFDLIGMLFTLAFVMIPISVGLAIMRFRLYDIDLLINRTLVYSALTATLALTYFGSVVLLQGLFRALTGQQQSELVTVVSTLAIAALFIPLRERVQTFIDRRFYRRKYDAAKTLAEFSATVRDEVKLDRLAGRLVSVVDETMQPKHISLWLNDKSKLDR